MYVIIAVLFKVTFDLNHDQNNTKSYNMMARHETHDVPWLNHDIASWYFDLVLTKNDNIFDHDLTRKFLQIIFGFDEIFRGLTRLCT